MITRADGEEEEILQSTTILWPWEFFAHLHEAGKLLQWIADDPATASSRTTEYWEHASELEFFEKLELGREEFGRCVPLYIHCDGVRVYRHQKMFIYSMSSACRKGPSMRTKWVFIVVRESEIVKHKTHASIAALVSYMVETLRSGKYPELDSQGCSWPVGSASASRAGKPFEFNWIMTFAAFKGDWEARQQVHRLNRYYATKYICEHCCASYEEHNTFGDFRMSANCLSLRFTHEQYLMMSTPSPWLCVRGWTKDRNLEEPHPVNKFSVEWGLCFGTCVTFFVVGVLF